MKPAKFIQIITRVVDGINYLYALDENGEIWKLCRGDGKIDVWKRVPTKRE